MVQICSNLDQIRCTGLAWVVLEPRSLAGVALGFAGASIGRSGLRWRASLGSPRQSAQQAMPGVAAGGAAAGCASAAGCAQRSRPCPAQQAMPGAAKGHAAQQTMLSAACNTQISSLCPTHLASIVSSNASLMYISRSTLVSEVGGGVQPGNRLRFVRACRA